MPGNEGAGVEALQHHNIHSDAGAATLNNLVHIISQVFRVPVAYISLVDKDKVFIKASVGLPAVTSLERNSLSFITIKNNAPTIVTDIDKQNVKSLTNGIDLKFYAGVPIITTQGYTIGTICIYDTSNRTFTAEEEQLLQRFAVTAMSEIEHHLSATETSSANNSAHTSIPIHSLKEYFNQAPVAIGVLRGENMVIESANAALLELWGKTNTVIGLELIEGLPEIKDQPFPDLLLEVYRSSKAHYGYETLCYLQRKEVSEPYYFNFVYAPIKEANGTVGSIMVIATEVTELVNAKIELQQSEQRYRNLVNEAAVATGVYIGEDNVIELANDAMIKLWGKDKTVIGKVLRDALPELEGQPFHQLLHNVYTTGNTYKGMEDRADLVVNGQLQTFYFNFTYKALRDVDGHIYGILNMAVDVTEQVRARREVEASEKKFKNLVYEAPVPTVIFNGPDLVIEIVNSAGLKLWGRDKNIIGKKLLDAYPELEAQQHISILKNVYVTGETYHNVESVSRIIVNEIPKTIYSNTSYKALRDAGGSITGVLVMSHDVTEQVVTRKAIEESEARFRVLSNSMPQLIWTGDIAGNLTYYNQAVYNFSGKTHEEIANDGWIEIVHPDDRQANIKKWIHAIATGEDFLLEHRFRRYDGVYRWQLSRAVPQKDDQGNIKMWIGTSTDIDEQKKMAEELESMVAARTIEIQQSNQQLMRTNKELEQYAYAASHDLQEPLRKIRVYSNMVADHLKKQEDIASLQRLEKVLSSAERMSQLVHDLLDFSKLQEAEMMVESTDLNHILTNVMYDFELLLEEKNAIIRAGNLPVIKASPVQMKQLFYNMVSNALKFSHTNRRPEITVTSRILLNEEVEKFNLNTDLRYFDICFSDNGIGFDKTYEKQIFQLFKRLHTKEKYSGTGIGLALCNKIVQLHHGCMYASSEEGSGSSFHIILPEKRRHKAIV